MIGIGGEIKAASVAWATADELTPAQRVRAQHDGTAAQASQKATLESRPATKASYWQTVAVRSPTADPILPPAPSAGEKERVPTEILIPAYVDPGGRDNLGRGLDAGSVAAAVAADRSVQREREALPNYLRGAYRDPHAAKAQLDEMVKRQGWTSTAARIAQDPAQLGELRGKVGFFAGAKAKVRVLTEAVQVF